MDILFELNESGANLSDDDIKSEVITIITAVSQYLKQKKKN